MDSLRGDGLRSRESAYKSKKRTKLTRALSTWALGATLGVTGFAHAEAEQGRGERVSTVSTDTLRMVGARCIRDKMNIIIHRGIGEGTKKFGDEYYTEDTQPAAEKGIRIATRNDGPADTAGIGFETDFWPTEPDDETGYITLVSNHDRTYDRTTDGTGRVSGRPAEYAMGIVADSGAPLSTFESMYTEMVEFSEEVLDGRELEYQQELKDLGPNEKARPLIKRMIDFNIATIPNVFKNVVISAGNINYLKIVNSIDPRIKTALINFAPKPPRPGSVPRFIDFINMHRRDATRQYIRSAHQKGFGVTARDINTVKQLRDFHDRGGRRAVTDSPHIGQAC